MGIDDTTSLVAAGSAALLRTLYSLGWLRRLSVPFGMSGRHRLAHPLSERRMQLGIAAGPRRGVAFESQH